MPKLERPKGNFEAKTNGDSEKCNVFCIGKNPIYQYSQYYQITWRTWQKLPTYKRHSYSFHVLLLSKWKLWKHRWSLPVSASAKSTLKSNEGRFYQSELARHLSLTQKKKIRLAFYIAPCGVFLCDVLTRQKHFQKLQLQLVFKRKKKHIQETPLCKGVLQEYKNLESCTVGYLISSRCFFKLQAQIKDALLHLHYQVC